MLTAGATPGAVYEQYADATGHAPPLRENAMIFWQVRKTPRRQAGPDVGPTSALYSCVPTGVHGPTCICWANLTAFLLQSRNRYMSSDIALGVAQVS